MTYPTGATTTTVAAEYIPKLWSNEIIATYKANLVLANLVTKINHQGKKGNTIYIPNFTRQTAASKGAGTAVTLKGATDTYTTVTISSHYEYSVLIDDIVSVQALSSLRRAYTEDAGFALAKQVDSDLHAQFESLNGGGASGTGTWAGAVIGGDGSTAYSPSSTGNGTDITDAGIRQVMLTLDNNDVPMENRYFVIPPIAKHDLLGISRFTEQAFTGQAGASNPILNGRIGEIYGMPVYVSTQAPTDTAADGSTLYRFAHIFHKSAIVFAEQQTVRTQTQYKQEYLADLMTADTIYGVAEMRDNAGITIAVPAI